MGQSGRPGPLCKRLAREHDFYPTLMEPQKAQELAEGRESAASLWLGREGQGLSLHGWLQLALVQKGSLGRSRQRAWAAPAIRKRPSRVRTVSRPAGSLWVPGPTPGPLGRSPWGGGQVPAPQTSLSDSQKRQKNRSLCPEPRCVSGASGTGAPGPTPGPCGVRPTLAHSAARQTALFAGALLSPAPTASASPALPVRDASCGR